MKKITLSLALTMALALGAGAATQHVKPGAGSAAWAGQQNVHENIAAAITAASSGDEIWVAQGTYSVSAALPWKNGVNVYGGFVGNETDKDLRSRDASLTVISRSGGTTRLLAAAAALTTPTTWSGFTIQNSTGGGVQMHANCILDNCIVKNNTYAGSGNVGGAGILADIGEKVSVSADIVIQNCRIINNGITNANPGGGIYARADGVSSGKFILKNSVIANNTSNNNGGGIAVNGIINEITNCTFAKNNRASGGWPGGAIYLNQTKQTTITNCIFWGNNDTYANPHPDMFVELPGSGSSIKNCIVSRTLTENTGGSVADIIRVAGNVTLEGNTVLTTPTDNSELQFASPYTGAAGYSAGAAAILNADWSILAGSIAKDAGATVAGITTDITGKGRPKFEKIDAGAYEYAATIDIAANASSADVYDAATMGDVIIRADNTGAGQWTAANTNVTDGVIKLVKTVEAGKVYAIGFPFAVSSVDKAFVTLQLYNGATNRFTDAASIEAGRGYLVSFADAGDVTFTSAPNPTLLTAYPEAAAEYKLVPALSLKNEASISGAMKYYSYTPSTSTWGGAEDAIAGGALSPFDAVVVSTAVADHYAAIGTGLEGTKWATVTVAGEGHVTVTEPASGSPYEMGFVDEAFDLKFSVGAGYVLSAVTIKTGEGQDEPYSFGTPVNGIYTVSIASITDSAAITITTEKQQFDVKVTPLPSGVNITLPAGDSPYKVYYDSAFVLKLTLDEPMGYFPLVALGSGDAFVPPTEGNEYVVTLSSVKRDTAITVTLVAKKTVRLTADAGITITAPAAVADSTYTVPEGSAFSYTFAVQAGYENPTVNGQPTPAGTYSFAADNDTTLTIAASPAKWKVTLNTDGTLTDITPETGSEYPAGGYEVEHGNNVAIQFKVADNKYPAATLPKGVAYVLTQAADVYTLTLPAVAGNVNVTLLAQDAVSLPKGVVPVVADVTSRGVGKTDLFNHASLLFIGNKGTNNGNSFYTHLKFDFNKLPLSTLAQFPSVQLKLTNSGWQGNDAINSQWRVTETADEWSEATPFLQSASPAVIATLDTFVFSNIHPAASATDNEAIYLDLTEYLKAWLQAPERVSDKTLSLRIENIINMASGQGGEMNLKSRENTGGDLGPKLIFGSVNTAVTDLTLGGTSIYQAGQYTYLIKVADSEIGAKMPAVAYKLSGEVDPSLVDVSITYTPADSTITVGQKNSITFTVAPIAALKGEGVSRTYAVNYRLPLVIGATEVKQHAEYTNGSYSDIIFNVTDASAGQLRVVAGGLTVQGVVKVVRTFEADKLYAVGFPFDAASSVTPSELFTYDGAQLQPATSIEKDKGYLIKFAAAGEVTFISTENPVLPYPSTVMPVTNSDYRFVASPYASNVFWVANMMVGGYYSYNSVGHYFQRISTTATSYIQVKPFEGIIVSTNMTAEYISLGSGSKLPHNVTWTKSAGVNITSGQAAKVAVPYDSAYVLTFTVDSCYEAAPAVTVGGSDYALDAPDANGAYTVRIGAVTTDTAIDISATIKTFAVTIANTTNVTLTEGQNTTLNCGTPYTVKFTVANGVVPAVTVNGVPYALGAPTGDVYAVTVTVSSPTEINIAAAAPQQVTVTADDSYITLLSSSGQATATPNVYEVAGSSAFLVTFRLATGYYAPQATGAAITGPDAGGIYTATIGTVMSDTAISITASLTSYSIQVNTGDVAQVTEPAAAPYTVEHGSAFTLKFTLIAGYENPQVAIGSAPYTPSLDAASGVYTVTTGAITSDTAISITASLKRIGVTVNSNSSVVTVSGVPSDVAYGDELTFTFTLGAHYENPQVTVNDESYVLGAPADGVYAVAVPNVTEAISVNISASLELVNVTVAASHVTVTSPAGESPYAVPYGSECTITFTVDEHYENPQVTVNGAGYEFADPVEGVYAVTGIISGATEVSITASPVMFDLTLTADANITLVTPAAAGSVPAAYGSAFVVSFRVAAGYAPVLKADGVEVSTGTPNADGVYTVTAVEQVTRECFVDLTATKENANAVYKEDPSDPVVRVQYYTIAGQEVREPAATGIYVVKRTHASKKTTAHKEVIVKTN
ncbi:MAG: hypothetical protein LBK18_06285 [Prevotellaceae bacterium]|jgi:hypothetical protein|nr:hypothetical protein [Prevotellaceae bacterium]